MLLHRLLMRPNSWLPQLSLALFACSAAMAQDPEPPPPPRWVAAARMQTARVDHCAVSLDGGQVLIAGGSGTDGALSSVEIYGPGDEFIPGPAMSVARTAHSCTRLLDGRVLVAGGSPTGGAEIFNVLTGSWTPVRGNVTARSGHTATLLPGGGVVLAGGSAGNEPTGLIEFFSPDTESITSAAAAMIERRVRHAAAALGDGRVLLIGGWNGSQILATNEIYDPATDSITAATPLALPRASHAAVSLPDGRVLIVGGEGASGELGNAEAYNEADGSMQWIASPLSSPMKNAFVALLPSRGLVLIAGGEEGGRALATTQYFLPSLNRFIEVGGLTAPRTRIAGAATAEGVLLATGGRNADGVSAACGVQSGPSVTVAPTNALAGSFSLFFPNQRLHATGRGFPGSREIKFSLRTSSGTQSDDRLLVRSIKTDSSGSFQADIFDAKASDMGVRFILTSRSPSGAINDGTSNTIVLGEVPFSSEVAFDVKASTSIAVKLLNPGILAGASVPMEVTINSPDANVPITGTVSVSIGSITTTANVLSALPGAPIPVLFCCAPAQGKHILSSSYLGDTRYAPTALRSSFGGELVTVVSNQVSINLVSPGLQLFTPAQATVQVRAAGAGVPRPTGTVSVRQTTGIPPPQAALPLGPDIRSLLLPGALAEFAPRAGFVDKPQVCYQIDYSGDASYPPVSQPNLCLPVAPATPTLQVTAPAEYTFGTPLPVSVALAFPPELGVTNRFIRVSPPTVDAKLQIGVGTATSTVSLLLPFGTRAVSINYTGGGDLSQVSELRIMRMRPAATLTTLDPVRSPTFNPVTLRATVRSVVPVGNTATGTTPVPTGTVQFLDGTLLLGQVQATANPDGSATAVLTNVARPVGARSFTSVYLGAAPFAGSTSPVLPVTIQ